MPVPVTCACGTQFDADDALAGGEAPCPGCQQPVAVPAAAAVPVRTSFLALASAILALVGAFTVVGTAVAAVLGLAGLVQVRRHRDRLAGTGLALFGLVAGVALTAATVFALTTGELFGFGSPTHLSRLGPQVDLTGPLEVVVAGKGFAITRPSPRWGRARNNYVNDPVVSLFLEDPDLLLVNPGQFEFVDAAVAGRGVGFDQCRDEALEGLQTAPANLKNFGRGNIRFTVEREEKDQAARLGHADWDEWCELQVAVRCGEQPWTFLIRIQKSAGGKVYLTRAYTQTRRFPAAEPDLRRALDSFRTLKGRW